MKKSHLMVPAFLAALLAATAVPRLLGPRPRAQAPKHAPTRLQIARAEHLPERPPASTACGTEEDRQHTTRAALSRLRILLAADRVSDEVFPTLVALENGVAAETECGGVAKELLGIVASDDERPAFRGIAALLLSAASINARRGLAQQLRAPPIAMPVLLAHSAALSRDRLSYGDTERIAFWRAFFCSDLAVDIGVVYRLPESLLTRVLRDGAGKPVGLTDPYYRELSPVADEAIVRDMIEFVRSAAADADRLEVLKLVDQYPDVHGSSYAPLVLDPSLPVSVRREALQRAGFTTSAEELEFLRAAWESKPDEAMELDLIRRLGYVACRPNLECRAQALQQLSTCWATERQALIRESVLEALNGCDSVEAIDWIGNQARACENLALADRAITLLGAMKGSTALADGRYRWLRATVQSRQGDLRSTALKAIRALWNRAESPLRDRIQAECPDAVPE